MKLAEGQCKLKLRLLTDKIVFNVRLQDLKIIIIVPRSFPLFRIYFVTQPPTLHNINLNSPPSAAKAHIFISKLNL